MNYLLEIHKNLQKLRQNYPELSSEYEAILHFELALCDCEDLCEESREYITKAIKESLAS